jgi:hypothetical protein
MHPVHYEQMADKKHSLDRDRHNCHLWHKAAFMSDEILSKIIITVLNVIRFSCEHSLFYHGLPSTSTTCCRKPTALELKNIEERKCSNLQPVFFHLTGGMVYACVNKIAIREDWLLSGDSTDEGKGGGSRFPISCLVTLLLL